MSLSQILEELFYDMEFPVSVLRKHNLEDLFEKSIQVIKAEIEKDPIEFGKFRDIASGILVAVNTRLREIDVPAERQYLELILKEVAEHLLSSIARSRNSERLMSEIYSALQTTASINGYNFEALVALLKLNQKRSNLLSSRLNGIFYYKWNGVEQDLSELIQTLKSEGWIFSQKDFRTLFTRHGNDRLQVQFNSERLPALIALFDVLKMKKFITPKGCKGHFYPLKRYLVDLENKQLIKNDPKRIKMIAKRNKENWEKLVTTAVSWVSGFKTEKLQKLLSPR